MNAPSHRAPNAAVACWIIAAVPALFAIFGLVYDIRPLAIGGGAWTGGLAVLGALFLLRRRAAAIIGLIIAAGAAAGLIAAAVVTGGGRAGFVLPAALLGIAVPKLARMVRSS